MEEIARVFGLNWKLLLAQAVNFGILVAALWYFLYRPVMNLLDERRAKIEQGVKSAESAERRLGEIEQERDDVLQKATNEATSIISTSKERAEEQASGIVAGANKRAETIVDQAQAQAAESKEQALRESESQIARAAILAAEKIMREKSN